MHWLKNKNKNSWPKKFMDQNLLKIFCETKNKIWNMYNYQKTYLTQTNVPNFLKLYQTEAPIKGLGKIK
jgi:hypothetical protein